MPLQLMTDDDVIEWAVVLTERNRGRVPRVRLECTTTSWYLAPQGYGRGRDRVTLSRERFVGNEMAARLRTAWPQDRAGSYVAISPARILSLLGPRAPSKAQLEAMAMDLRAQEAASHEREERLTLWTRAAFLGAPSGEVYAWQLRPHPDLEGASPWRLAFESEDGLTRALEVLTPLVNDTWTRVADGFHLEIDAEHTAALLLPGVSVDDPGPRMRGGVEVVAHLYRCGTHVGIVSITPEPDRIRPAHPDLLCSVSWLILDTDAAAADAALESAAQRYSKLRGGDWPDRGQRPAPPARFGFLRDILLMRALRAD